MCVCVCVWLYFNFILGPQHGVIKSTWAYHKDVEHIGKSYRHSDSSTDPLYCLGSIQEYLNNVIKLSVAVMVIDIVISVCEKNNPLE